MAPKETQKDTCLELKNISAQDFECLGLQRYVYIKPMKVDGYIAYAIHAADGTPLSVMEDKTSAIVVVQNNDLEAVAVH